MVEVLHLFLLCPAAKAIWFASWNLRIESLSPRSLCDGIQLVSDHCIQLNLTDPLVMIAVTMEAIWCARNDLTHNSTQPDFQKISKIISFRHTEIQKVFYPHLHPSDNTNVQTNTIQSWSPPPIGYLKVNFDAAFRPNLAASGSVARSSTGAVISMASNINHSKTPEEAEAYAALSSLQWAVDNNWENIYLEGDAAAIVELLNNLRMPPPPPWHFAGIIEDARMLIQRFNSCIVIHTPRSTNTPAHELARWAAALNHSGILFPPCIPSQVSLALTLDSSSTG